MALLRFHDAALLRDLTRVPKESRVAFAAACAERLQSAHAAFCERAGTGDPVVLGVLLGRAWQHLIERHVDTKWAAEAQDQCLALMPSEEPYTELQPQAKDAVAAVLYTLRTLETGEPREAAWAAQRAYDALDNYVVTRLGGGKAMIFTPWIESQVLTDPIVQVELVRQQRDLSELSGMKSESAELFARLRDRAKGECASFLGVRS
jgi:uncharacterized protein YjaG (DUF416 family)